MIRLTLPYPPTANLYWRVYRGRPVKSNEARAYQQGVRFRAAAARAKPIAGDVYLRAVLYRPARRGDLDNTLKVLLDALQGYAYANDNQIVELHAVRLEDPADPRVEVTVEPWRPAPTPEHSRIDAPHHPQRRSRQRSDP